MTRSPIELLWTAKKDKLNEFNYKADQLVKLFCSRNENFEASVISQLLGILESNSEPQNLGEFDRHRWNWCTTNSKVVLARPRDMGAL